MPGTFFRSGKRFFTDTRRCIHHQFRLRIYGKPSGDLVILYPDPQQRKSRKSQGGDTLEDGTIHPSYCHRARA